ncbi:hypothetical protein I302_105030 [Kwoniella bestiolae CBS 10118]|uniref:Uncharacterized protein n=1 Tax=Kwoniella bestiolae CBS 10118 TaxID=1296100 RepID=A0A1B9FR26_9TREE|nr:hypothetical protein I302_08896 [Kwoniella bestiolae CBS 10118]OCF21224.1 hypothetical protein I302_08896 [Kwoniella bestiolae CBS 10118]
MVVDPNYTPSTSYHQDQDQTPLDEQDIYILSTPSKTRWQHLLELVNSTPLDLPPIPLPPQEIERSHSSLGLLNVPPPTSLSMSRISSSEGAEDLFGYSDILSSFPSTRRPSIISYTHTCPPSPELRPTSRLRDSVDLDIDVDMEMDQGCFSLNSPYAEYQDMAIDDDELTEDYISESSFGHSPRSHFTPSQHQDLWTFRSMPDGGSPASSSSSGSPASSSSSGSEDLIITPFSDILHLPNPRSRPEEAEEDGEVQISSFSSGSYPTSTSCVGLGISFGSSSSFPSSDEQPSPQEYEYGVSPVERRRWRTMRMSSQIDWASFSINSLSIGDNEVPLGLADREVDGYLSDKARGLMSSPIPYFSPLCRS